MVYLFRDAHLWVRLMRCFARLRGMLGLGILICVCDPFSGLLVVWV